MTYRFKPLPELYWGVVIAASLVLLQALLTLDPEAVKDWRFWAVALGGGMVRAAAGAALDYIRRSVAAEPEPTLADEILALPESDLAALRIELERRRAAPSAADPLPSIPRYPSVPPADSNFFTDRGRG